jgi:hypothetical protein
LRQNAGESNKKIRVGIGGRGRVDSERIRTGEHILRYHLQDFAESKQC